jgi:hypothetical protein
MAKRENNKLFTGHTDNIKPFYKSVPTLINVSFFFSKSNLKNETLSDFIAGHHGGSHNGTAATRGWTSPWS